MPVGPTRMRTLTAPFLAGAFVLAISGIVLASPRPGPVLVAAPLVLLSCVIAIAAYALRGQRLAAQLVVTAMIALGVWRGAAALADTAQPWTNAPNVSVQALGTVEAPPTTRGSTIAVRVQLEEVTDPPHVAVPPGLVELTLPALDPVGYGDRLAIVGRFEPVDPATPNGRRLLATRVVATALLPATAVVAHDAGNRALNILLGLRQRLARAAGAALPEPYATLVAGMVLGLAGSIPDSLRQGLVATGTTHMLVVDGYKISLVAAALQAVVIRWRGARLVVPLLGVWGFTLLTGGGAPSVRAALMATVAVLARGTGRGSDALGALAIACAIMLALDPGQAAELGFQISALATLGVITLEPRVATLLARLPTILREPLAATFAAELATSPLLAITFHQIAPASPIAHIVLTPLLPLISITGAVLLPVVALVPPLAPLAGLALYPQSWLFVQVATQVASIPHVVLPVGDVPPGLIALYAASLLLWAVWPTAEGQDLRDALRAIPLARRAAYGIVAGLLAALLGWSASTAAPAALQLAVLDVGGDDAVFVRTPRGQTILIDGGSNPSALLALLGGRLGLLERNVTIAILTRPDPAHLPGLSSAAARYTPDLLVLPNEPSTSAAYAQLVSMGQSTTFITVDTGMVVNLESGITLELIPTAPLTGPASDPSPPLRSIAVRIVDGSVAMLVAPGLTAAGVHDLVEQGWDLRSAVYLVPYHGDRVALDSDELAAIDPAVAVITVSPRDRANNPNRAVLDLLRERQVYRTDEQGTITIETDGTRLAATSERAPSPR